MLGGFRTLVADPTERTFQEAIQAAGFRGPLSVFLQETALRTADATGALARLDARLAGRRGCPTREHVATFAAVTTPAVRVTRLWWSAD